MNLSDLSKIETEKGGKVNKDNESKLIISYKNYVEWKAGRIIV